MNNNFFETKQNNTISDRSMTASKEFDVYSDWLETVLASDQTETELQKKCTITIPQKGDCNLKQQIVVEGTANICISCKNETTLPLLCKSCMDNICLGTGDIDPDLDCPWHIDPDICIALLEGEHGELIETSCAGKFFLCEQTDFLKQKDVKQEEVNDAV